MSRNAKGDISKDPYSPRRGAREPTRVPNPVSSKARRIASDVNLSWGVIVLLGSSAGIRLRRHSARRTADWTHSRSMVFAPKASPILMATLVQCSFVPSSSNRGLQCHAQGMHKLHRTSSRDALCVACSAQRFRQHRWAWRLTLSRLPDSLAKKLPCGSRHEPSDERSASDEWI